MQTREGLIELLNELLIVDHDGVRAYRAAVAALENAGAKRQFSSFCSDHERHVEELTLLVLDLGGVPATPRELSGFLAKGKVSVGSVAGDRGILAAMRSNEDIHNAAYLRAVKAPSVPHHIRAVLTRNLSDEHRHRGSIEARSRHLSSAFAGFGPPARAAI
jgi:uncharacterized protein (TIGR02284 family)